MASYPGALHVGGRSEDATLYLEGPGLRVVTDRGVTYRVAYKELSIDITTDHALYGRTTKGDLAISTHATECLPELKRRGAHVEEQVHAQLDRRQHHHRSRRWLRILLGGVAGFVLLLWLLPKVLLLFIDWAPKSIDRKLGEAVYAELDLGSELEDPRILGPVQEILARLGPHAQADGYELRLHVYSHRMVNAFALPGGHMVLTTGLLGAAQSPEEVAAVVAHELAHVTRRHSLRSFVKGSGAWALAKILATSDRPFVGAAAVGAAATMMLRHQRDQEADADRVALTTLAKAQLDGRALATMLQRMEALHGGDDGAPEWAQTHPETANRVAAIDQELTALGVVVNTPLSVRWSELQGALPEPSEPRRPW